MKTVCEQNQCVGCGACADICSKGAVRVEDRLTCWQAVIDEKKCVQCDACHRVCQAIHPIKLRTVQKWYQGWAADETVRANSSSGGLAAAISRAFVQKGGSVCSCVFEKGEFIFQFAEQEDEVAKFRGSKYVKSNAAGIYKQIKSRLDMGKKVLFIGLPCQAAAVRNYVGDSGDQSLYIIDLICHGTPSPQILAKFLQEHGYSINGMNDIHFRSKDNFYLHFPGMKAKKCLGKVEDSYLMAFLRGICYFENCYQCVYAQNQRCSDITLGDSWGSELSSDERKKGISLALCFSSKGIELLNMSKLMLQDVDLDKAMEANTQLRMPCLKPKAYPIFFYYIKKGRSMEYAMFRAWPKAMIKNKMKCILSGFR